MSSIPNVLSIAGFDPSAGAGILSDIKTFESNNVYGLGVCSAITYQNDVNFKSVDWLSIDNIISQVEILKKRFDFSYVKIGLIESIEVLEAVIAYLTEGPRLETKYKKVKIIWDPILSASAGYEFHKDMDQKVVEKICSSIYLITPNWVEVSKLGATNEAVEAAQQLSKHCNVYLKGGHSEEETARDILFSENQQHVFEHERISNGNKHGSGCVLSSTITAGLARELSLFEACKSAKDYVNMFFKSSNHLIGHHSPDRKSCIK